MAWLRGPGPGMPWRGLAGRGRVRFTRTSPPAEESRVAPSMPSMAARRPSSIRIDKSGRVARTVTTTLTRHEVQQLVAGETAGVLHPYPDTPQWFPEQSFRFQTAGILNARCSASGRWARDTQVRTTWASSGPHHRCSGPVEPEARGAETNRRKTARAVPCGRAASTASTATPGRNINDAATSTG